MMDDNATPTWAGLLLALLHVIRTSESQEAVDDVTGELLRMAQAADAWNAYCKARSEGHG